jgi:hypothetical protein
MVISSMMEMAILAINFQRSKLPTKLIDHVSTRSRIKMESKRNRVRLPRTQQKPHLNVHNGLKIEASAAEEFLGDPTKIDPEAAFVASLSNCHMLTFLANSVKTEIKTIL